MAHEKALQIGGQRVVMRVADPTPEPALPVVNIAVEGRVAGDLKAMRKVTAAVLAELNHPNCHSGYDLRFDWVTNYAVNEKLEVIPQPPRAGY